MLRCGTREVKVTAQRQSSFFRPDSRGRLSPHKHLKRRPLALLKGVTPFSASGYNQSVMSTVCDAEHQSQFAFARVLAALPGVSAALPGEPAFAVASQPVR